MIYAFLVFLFINDNNYLYYYGPADRIPIINKTEQKLKQQRERQKMLKVPQSAFLKLQNLNSTTDIRDNGSFYISLQKSNYDVVIVSRNGNVIVSSVETTSVGTLFHISTSELSTYAVDFSLMECRCYMKCSNDFLLLRLPLLAVSLRGPAKGTENTANEAHSILLYYKRDTMLHVKTLTVDNVVLNIRLIPIVDESNHVLFILIIVILSTQLRLYTAAVKINNEELIISEDILLIYTIETKAAVCIETATVVNCKEHTIQGNERNGSPFDNLWKGIYIHT